MKICLRQRCERMVINDDHHAACWMNVKLGIEDGSIVPEDPQETDPTETDPALTDPTETDPPIATVPAPTYPTVQPHTQRPTAAATQPVPQYQASSSGISGAKESGLTFSAVLGGLLIGGSAVILYLKKRCS